MLGTIIFWRNGGKYPPISRYLLGCPCKLVTIVRKLVYFTYLRDLRALLIKGWDNPLILSTSRTSQKLICLPLFLGVIFWKGKRTEHEHYPWRIPMGRDWYIYLLIDVIGILTINMYHSNWYGIYCMIHGTGWYIYLRIDPIKTSTIHVM